jgi:hypothetical protein
MTVRTAGMTDRDINEIVVEALVAHRVNWCRARFLHALVTAGEQGVLEEVLAELLPAEADEILEKFRAALVASGWHEASHPWRCRLSKHRKAPWPKEDALGLEQLRDLLALVDRDASVDQIASWTASQRAQAERWAGREHLAASDNPVRRLKIPPHVAALPAMLNDGLWPRSRFDNGGKQ